MRQWRHWNKSCLWSRHISRIDRDLLVFWGSGESQTSETVKQCQETLTYNSTMSPMRSETYRFLRLTPRTNDLPVRWEVLHPVSALAVWRTFSQPIKLQNGRERAWPKTVRIEHRSKRNTNFWPFIQFNGQCSAYNFLCEGATRVVMVHRKQRGHTGVRANWD